MAAIQNCEPLALGGLRIAVTRAGHQAEDLAGPLRLLGAEVLLAPMIGIGPPLDEAPLRAAALTAATFDWILFTSANAVSAFCAALQVAGVSLGSLTGKVATVGAATRAAAEQHGFQVTVTPEEAVAESLVDALGAEQVAGKNILLPSAAITRDVAPAALRQRGATVTVVEAYQNVLPVEAREDARRVFRDPLPDWVIFASSSAVDNAARIVPADILRRVKIASIGPVTTRTVEKLGFRVTAEANPHSVEGLVKALAAEQAKTPMLQTP